MIVADPWYDYLALPIAPVVLFLQLGALFIPRFWLRAAASLACFAAIAWMNHYVSSIDLAPDEGANIGAGVMLLWWTCSILLLGAAVVGEAARIVVRRAGLMSGDG
jgi:hypothetical protein